MAALHIALSRIVVSRIISWELLISRFACFGLSFLGGPRWLRRRCSFEECSALCENSFESVNIFLNTWSRVGGREFDAGKGTTVGTKIPARDQITCRRLMVDLGRSRQREIELRR
jgi:hypothetical protein